MNTFMPDRPIRVGIVNDNVQTKRIMHSNLALFAEIEVVAEAENWVDAIAMVEFARPDVVLIGSDVPVIDGIEATRIIHSNFPDTQVIIFTMFPHWIYSDNAFQAGACHVLIEDCRMDKLLEAIKECSAGPLRIVGHPPH